ncbi:ABC transporter permease [Coprococcus catus]|jgi:ABC-type dipeptide/oligopeptide/nickel transport system permease component|uniref:Nickel import system permease protein NikB n=1 Tax=Coprococcus catus TaxID=116085 RepID=A0A3E2XPF9_9FIRM|nr:nickel ABC transporter permease [Coprococcus catus]RGC50434.1 ABC transporter permease [Coprococcus catus]
MVRYILKRLLQLVVVLLGVTFLTFMITQATPSDAAEMKYVSMGMMPSTELLEKTREEMGLNDPVLIQYGRWLGNVLHGDLGESSKFGESVWTQMTRKLPMTLKLAGVSLIVVIVFSFPLGILSAVKKNKVADYMIRFLSFFGVSMPNFWLALLLMYIFAVRLGWFKVVSTNSVQGMILPVATLTIPMISSYARQIRAALLEELNANYVIGARARGIPERRIIWGHVLPNAILPIVTLLGLSVGHLLGGAAIIETIFSWQGIGNMVVEAIRVRDYPLIQGYVIWMAIIYVTVNLIVDIAYRLLDPQIRLRKRVD